MYFVIYYLMCILLFILNVYFVYLYFNVYFVIYYLMCILLLFIF